MPADTPGAGDVNPGLPDEAAVLAALDWDHTPLCEGGYSHTIWGHRSCGQPAAWLLHRKRCCPEMQEWWALCEGHSEWTCQLGSESSCSFCGTPFGSKAGVCHTEPIQPRRLP